MTSRGRLGRRLYLNRRGVAAACVGVVVFAGAEPVALAKVAHPHRPKPALGRSVATTHAPAVPAARVSAASVVAPAPVAIPAGSYTAAVRPGTALGVRTASPGLSYGTPSTVSSPWTPLGSTGISAAAGTPLPLARAGAARANSVPTVPVTQVGITVLTAAAAGQVVTSGVGLTLHRTDGKTGVGGVAVRVPDALLANRFGGDFVSRVRWLQVPLDKTGHPLTGQAQPVAFTRDGSGGGATVMSALVSSRPVMLVAASVPTSSTGAGSWAATTLKPSSTWQVSTQTGDFTWSYPLRVPPAPAGPSPAVSFGYDAQSVDGETGATNNQADELGDGWSLGGSGFVERSYVPCSQDDGPTGPVKTSGDLCWSTDNATVSFGGHSGRLIKDSGGTWKISADDGTRVEYLTGAANGCGNATADDGCWRLTTADGTQYYFGRNKLPNWATGNTQTNSAWTVPVFGNDPGEPGYNGDGTHAGTFATEATTQAWRWNLDYVVDPHGNSEAFYYDPEYNHYAQNGTTFTQYIRGGVLDHIDYGMRAGSEYAANAASGKVLFAQAANGRCFTSCSSVGATAAQIANPTKPTTTTNYFDTPWDQYCTASPCTGLISPTFWSAQMLSSVTTEVLSGGAYTPVDVYSLTQSFPPVPTGAGESPALWLASIGHTGKDGTASVSTPSVTFGMLQMQNRVYTANGLSPLERYRIGNVNLDSGAQIAIVYSAQQCTAATDGSATSAAVIEANPQTNTYRCFPAWWTPQVTPPLGPSKDLFHKYVVTTVYVSPMTGGLTDKREETDYVYTGTPAWRFNTAPGMPDDYRTWSDYAGYSSVEVRVGDPTTPSLQQTTDYTYLQGMDGDPCGPLTSPTSQHRYAGGCAASGSPLQVSVGGTSITDSLWSAGQAVQTVTHNGVGGPVLSTTVSTPWASAATASTSYSYTQTDTSVSPAVTYSGVFSVSAHLTGTSDSKTTTPVSTGGNRTLETKTSYDSTYGLPTQVESDSSDAGTTCTRTSYVHNTTSWLINYPSEVATVAVPCASTPSYPGDAVSDSRYSYDGGALGAAPSKGEVSQQQTVKDYTGATPNWITTSSQYDALGRTTQTTDPAGRITKTAYTPAAGGPVTEVDVTNNAGWVSKSALRPNWGVPSQVTDVNGEVTTATYDPLGRVVKVWLPNRPQATNTVPSIGYAYTLSTTAANAIATTTLNSVGGTITGYQLFDGLDRPVQTQTWTDSRSPTNGGHQAIGSIVTTTQYDAAGRVNYTTDPFGTSTNPSVTLISPTNGTTIPGEVFTSFDGAGRPTTVSQHVDGAAVWNTTYSYSGADRTDTIPPTGGTPTSSFVDSRGRQTSLMQYEGTGIGGSSVTTSYGYDARNDLTSMADQNGNTWTWSYDQLGNRVSATDPDTGITSTTYNADSTVNTTTDGNGKSLHFTYDLLGRKTGEYAGTDTTGPQLAGWTYDPTYGSSQVKGQPASSTRYIGGAAGSPGTGDAYTQTVTGYNALYQPTGQSLTLPPAVATQFGLPTTGASYTTTTGYGTNGTTVTTHTLPAVGGMPTENQRFSYTSLDNLYGFGAYNLTDYMGDDTFTNTNLPSQIQLGNGTTELDRNFYYSDGLNRLTRILTENNATTNFHVADDTYTYDNAGKVTSATDKADGPGTDTQCFSYDQLQNLTAAWTPSSNSCTAAPSSSALGGPAPYWTSYTIDPITGNRTSSVEHATSAGGTDTTDTYTPTPGNYGTGGNGGPHSLQKVTHAVGGTTTGTDNYTYAPGGQTLTRPGQTLSYDAEDNLAASTLTSTGAIQNNVYTADGSLLYQNDPTTGGTLYLGDTQLYAPPTGAVCGVRTYTALGITIAERTTASGTNVLRWLATSPNNTATTENDALTNATTHRYFDPYGNPRGTTTAWSSRNGYLNAPQNPFAGTTQLGARSYDPTTGRFLTVDPVLDPSSPQQANGYSYANNNPTTNADPTGAHLCDNATCSTPGTSWNSGQTQPTGPQGGSSGGGGSQGSGTGSSGSAGSGCILVLANPNCSGSSLGTIVGCSICSTVLPGSKTMPLRSGIWAPDAPDPCGNDGPYEPGSCVPVSEVTADERCADSFGCILKTTIGVLGLSLTLGAPIVAGGGLSADSVGLADLGELGTDSTAEVDASASSADLDGYGTYYNRHGQLTNGIYTLDESGMAPHMTGSTTSGKSQFFSWVDADTATLDAANYADKNGLWVGNRAKVYVINGPVGSIGRTGELTSWINVYRTNSGFVHGAPGSAP